MSEIKFQFYACPFCHNKIACEDKIDSAGTHGKILAKDVDILRCFECGKLLKVGK